MAHFHHTNNDWHYSDKIFKETCDTILKLFKIDYSYDIPYVAGYDSDGTVIFVDKDVYKALKEAKKEKWLKPLCYHEAIEKIILMHSGDIAYQEAHQNALRLELELLDTLTIDKKEYDAFMDKYIKKIGDMKSYHKIPKDLDLTPYKDEKDFSTLKKMLGNNFKLIKDLEDK